MQPDEAVETPAEDAAEVAEEQAVVEPVTEAAATEDSVISKAQVDGLRRELAAYRRQAKKADLEAAEAKRKRLEDEGQYQTLAQQAEERAVAAEDKARNLEQRQLISQVANRLKYRDPADAIAHLKDRGVEAEDEAAVEAALTALATEKQYLIDTPQVVKTGGSISGEASTTVTLDELKAMTPAQISALDQSMVDQVLSGS